MVKEQLASLKPHTYTGVEGATSAEGEQLLHPRQIKPVILPQVRNCVRGSGLRLGCLG